MPDRAGAERRAARRRFANSLFSHGSRSGTLTAFWRPPS